MFAQLLIVSAIITSISLISYFQIQDRIFGVRKVDKQEKIEESLQNYIELYRAQIKNTLLQENITPSEFIAGLRCGLKGNCKDLTLFRRMAQTPNWARPYLRETTLPDIAPSASVQVMEVSEADIDQQKLTFRLKLSGDIKTEKEIQLRLGLSAVFKNAMTGNSFQCIMCHSVVMGDLGQYHSGWHSTANATQIHGRLLLGGASNCTDCFMTKVPVDDPLMPVSNYPNDDTDQYTDYYVGRSRLTSEPADLALFGNAKKGQVSLGLENNPAYYTFMHGVVQNYRGASLPWNFVRQKMMLPKFDPSVMSEYSSGSLRGNMIQVPFMTKLPSDAAFKTLSIKGTYDGNVIIDGRTRAINISGRVFVKGDVIIMGQVSGQGAIYSGRNIYVAGNLTYQNPPPHFDGSEASNKLMREVSTKGKDLAFEMTNYDQLALFATNNVILGDPFDTELDIADRDHTFYNRTNLAAQSASRGLAYDPANGEMYDLEVIDNRWCYVKPWAPYSTCRFKEGAYPDKSKDVVVTPIRLRDQVPAVSIPTDREYVLSESATQVSHDLHHQANVQPMNYRDGSSIAWVGRNEYFNLTVNTSDAAYTRANGVDSYNRRGRTVEISLPPVMDDAYDIAAMDANTLVNKVEEVLGSITEFGGRALDVGDPAVAQGTYTLRGRLVEFINKCKSEMITRNGVATGFAGLNRNTVNDIKSRLQHENLTPLGLPAYMAFAGCSFFVDAEASLTSGGTTRRGFARGYMARYFGSSTEGWVVNHGDTIGEEVCSDNGVSTLPCLSRSGGGSLEVPSGFEGARALGTGDFILRILWIPDHQRVNVFVKTRYYSPTKVRYRNKITKVQALLFANQYVSYMFSSDADRQLRIHGGVIAKDYLGRFVNLLGSERQYIPNPNVTAAYQRTTGILNSIGIEGGTMPALWVISDPRFQFTQDLINSDFLSVVTVR